MKIVIISATCSPTKYGEICSKRTVKSLDTNQKFFSSIISGFKANGYKDITCVSVLPVSYRTFPEKIIQRQEEFVDDVEYIYCKTYNYPLLRNFYSAIQVKKEVKKLLIKYKKEDVLFITDGLFCEFGKACNLMHRKNRSVFTILTDIPSYVCNMNARTGLKQLLLGIYGKRGDKVLNNLYDGYIFLTKYMNDLCNRRKKPFTVIEGLLDDTIFPKKEQKARDSELPVVLYAGKYNSEFGVLNLAKSAEKLEGVCKIELYGANGDCMDELRRLEIENDNLTVNGIIELPQLVQKEVDADLLINPRPGKHLFTRYSFPSKTLEYMNSGTPVLMYRLEGIPKEYDEFLYYIDGDKSGEDEIATAIKTVLSSDKNIFREKGLAAQRFVRENKNNVSQTKKILDFIINHEKNQSCHN